MVAPSDGCPTRHRGGVPLKCLLEHGAAWAIKREFTPATEVQVREWRRADLLPRPQVRPLGRGSIGVWSPLAYRRILAIVRLRQQGVRRTAQLRTSLWLAGHQVQQADAVGTVRGEVQRLIRSTVRDMRVDRFSYRPDETRPRLRIVRRVEALTSVEPCVLFAGAADLSPEQEAALRLLFRDPLTRQAFEAMVELMVEGHRPGAVQRLQAIVPRLPPGLIDEAGMKEMIAPFIGAISPEEDNSILGNFDIVTYADLERARDFFLHPSQLSEIFRSAARALRAGEFASTLPPAAREVLAVFYETYPALLRASEDLRLFVTALFAEGNALRRTGKARHWVPAVIEGLPA
jgi:hypothetical protein